MSKSGPVRHRPARSHDLPSARRRRAGGWKSLSWALAAGTVIAAVLRLTNGPDGSPDGSAPLGGVGVAAGRAGTAAMAQRLVEIADAADVLRPDQQGTPLFGTNQPALIPVLRGRVAATTDAIQQIQLHFQLANQLLLSGNSAEALQEFEALQGPLADEGAPPDQLASLQGAIAIAALRLGEQQNCILNHGASSCLFPIEQGGVHSLQGGSRRAIEAFERRLDYEPDNLGARWLLNLAYMTVGEYPQGVPARWRIHPEVFRSDYDIGRFVDVAPATGLDMVGLAGGSITEDFDGDGDLDVMASSWGLRDQIRFFRNDGAGRFVDRTREAGLWGEVGGINLTHADYDNDGHPDVYVMRGGWLGEAGLHPDSLLRSHGDGTFEDVTEAAGLLSFEPTHTAAWGDFDGDGFLDLFVGHEDWGPGTHAVQLFHNNRDGTFTDQAPLAGFGVLGMVKGVAWGDFNNDGRIDLYVSRFAAPNMLFRNDGNDASGRPHFTDVARTAGVEAPILSFPTWFWDYDNDGWLDIFVGGWDGAPIDAVAARYLGVLRPDGTPRLYRNNHDGTFEDVTAAAKLDRVLLAMGANFGDLDNDGFPDLYVGTGSPDLTTLMPNRMFRNVEGRYFQDVTTSGGFGHLQKGHGVSFADLDNDGDQDVYAVLGGWFTGDAYQNALFENPGHHHHWVTIQLEGARANRMGLGARLKLHVETPAGPRDIYKFAVSGGSFGGSTLRQEIGLGDATAIDTIEIRWPGVGETEVLHDLPLDQFLSVRESETEARRLPRAAFRLGAPAPRDHAHGR